MASSINNRNSLQLITTTVEPGPVRELVSVSGIAKAKQTADLAFPITGIVKKVYVETGDNVEDGDLLISLESDALSADRQEGVAALARAVADRDELLQGPTKDARDATEATVKVKESLLNSTRENEAQKVTNAYRNLLSTGLTAYSTDINENAVVPTISGTYTCGFEGIYKLDVYSSGSDSGYSYRLSGLESDVASVSVDQPADLGTCGLRIVFGNNSNYSNSLWQVDIPNMKSSLYVTSRNAYALALTQEKSALSNAEQELASAIADATNQNSPARSEAITRANAAIAQASARLNRIDSTISDRTLTAPFAGVITDIDILPGETVTLAPVVTLLGDSQFEVTARIPEIDIGKLLVGQKVKILFDAKAGEILDGEIDFISLKATEIDGVTYYEAIIDLAEVPVWMRSGLNADIEIIISEESNGLRIPKRFITETDTGHEVIIQENGFTATTSVEIVLEGNDGFVSIVGLNEGDIIIAP